MDEEEIIEDVSARPIRHDRWSILILGLGWATQVVEVSASTLGQFTLAAAQHANHVKEQDQFLEVAKHWGN